MSANRLLLVAIAGETALALGALAWIDLRRLPLDSGPPFKSVAVGMASAALFALANFYLLRWAPAVVGVRSIRRLYSEILKPLFAEIRAVDMVLIGLAAGVGEGASVSWRGASGVWARAGQSAVRSDAHRGQWHGRVRLLGRAEWACARVAGNLDGWTAGAHRGPRRVRHARAGVHSMGR